MMMHQMLLVLFALQSYVVTATIPPGYALQEHLCSGQLELNTNLVLSDGEHRISSGPPCHVSTRGNISIVGSSMKNTTVHCEGEGRVFEFISAQTLSTERITFINCGIHLITIENILITECTFQDKSKIAIFAESVNNRSSIKIEYCLFINNNGYNEGGGVSLHFVTGNVSISHCTFQNNTATFGGGVRLLLFTGNVSISHCTFQNNSGGGGVSLLESTGDVSISHCTFQNNTATFFGGGVSLQQSTGDVSISHCTFQNTVTIAGGGVSLGTSTCNVSISHCTFQNNTTGSGGGVSLLGSTGNVSISHCTFQNNTAANGGGGVALWVSTGDVSISHCTFQNNTATTGSGGGVLLLGSTGNVSISHCTFQNNIATTGGGVERELFSAVGRGGDIGITNCTFQNNSAINAGGAVFSWVGVLSNILNSNDMELNGKARDVNIKNCTFHNNRATYGGAIFFASIRSTLISGSTFTNNTAIGGAAVYAVNNNPSINYYDIIFTLNAEPFGHLILQGVMVKDNLCSCNDYDKLRGGAIYFNGMRVDIFGSTFTGSQFSSNSPLGAIQGTNGFLNLHGNITFSNNTGVNGGAISLSNNVPLYFYEGCAVEFSRNAATGFGGALYNAGDKEKVILTTSKLTTGDLVTQSGICPNLTSYITTTPSHKDINGIQLLSFPNAVGALLVAALFFLNFTVTQGTLYGLIFYANIIQINSSIFFHQAIPSLQIIVSFINLDLGIPMCFYNGMDDADKAGLQFVFPAYLLILTLTVIVICHYCLQRSPNTTTSSCLYRFPIIIGERAVGVLCTLIYLSYYKLLRTVIDIFTYSTVHLPSGDMNVWFYDGNVAYLQGKHATLFIIAVMTCALFLLPYTFALTFIPIIERYSEHNRLFNYLHKLANKFKPVNDAHYAPYKGEWRWWLGARLWLVVVMYSLNPVYSSDNPSLLLSIQATLVMLFMLVQANIQPFGQPLQKMDKCNRHTSAYNTLYNCLDLMYLLNYTALAMSMSYILGKSSNETQISVSVLVGLYVAMLLVTVLYHFIVAILKACSTYDRAKEKINGIFERKDEVMVPTELEESTTYTVSTTTVTVTNHLREPLCED
eukprot:Em0035g7a